MVFSAHGVAPEVHEQAKERNLKAIDATCPLVTKVHHEARRFAAEDYDILLIGHEGHEEVIGTSGEAPAHIQLVDGPDGVDKVTVRDPSKVVWLSQTTLSVDETLETVARLKKKLPLLQSPPSDDICYATQNRQQVMKQIAPDCDVVLVVGSKNSSNSVRMVEVAVQAGAAQGHLIDFAHEIEDEWLEGATTVGLSSGASVPEELVEQVLAHLAERGFADVEEVVTVDERLIFSLPQELKRDMKAAAHPSRLEAVAGQELGCLSLAGCHLDRLQFGREVAGDAQLVEAASGHEHPLFEGADGLVVGDDRGVQRVAELREMAADCTQTAIKLFGKIVDLDSVTGERLLPPRVGDRAQQSDQSGRCSQHHVAGESVLQQGRIVLESHVEKRLSRNEKHHELGRLGEGVPVVTRAEDVDVSTAKPWRASRTAVLR